MGFLMFRRVDFLRNKLRELIWWSVEKSNDTSNNFVSLAVGSFSGLESGALKRPPTQRSQDWLQFLRET